jgi:sulfur carrier protein
VKLLLNGKEKELPDAMTLKGLIEQFQLRSEITVVELNEEIIKQGEYEKTVLKSQDKVELVTMMGGGR